MTDTPGTKGAASSTTINSTQKKAFQPQDDWVLLSQGAEARIWKIPASPADDNDKNKLNTTAARVAKERFSKAYRHPTLDEKLTKSRCRAEGRILEKCRNPKDKAQAIDVPQVLRTEPPILYLEFIEGMTVREYLEDHLLSSSSTQEGESHDNTTSTNEKELQQLAKQIGTMVGKLHTLGCIHGDLTTSNMMLRQQHKRAKTTDKSNSDGNGNKKITLIDFGLAKNTTSAEERAVDLYVLERALTSTHPKLPESFLETILEAYQPSVEPAKAAEATLQRLEQVRLRGRKRECFG